MRRLQHTLTKLLMPCTETAKAMRYMAKAHYYNIVMGDFNTKVGIQERGKTKIGTQWPEAQ